MKRVLFFFTLAFLSVFSVSFGHAQTLYLVELISKADKPVLSQEAVNQIQKEHLAHIRELNNAGVLLAAGPFEGGGGLFILQCNTIDEARDAVSSDPAVKASRFDFALTPYNATKGFICQVHESAEMVSLVFVKITPASGRRDDFQVQKVHRDFLAKNIEAVKVVYEGWNSSIADGFLVISGSDVAGVESLFSKHPLKASGSLDISVKGLWIADGAFCE